MRFGRCPKTRPISGFDVFWLGRCFCACVGVSVSSQLLWFHVCTACRVASHRRFCVPYSSHSLRGILRDVDAVEDVMNMNETTGKFARWVLRVRQPHITEYTFLARNERVRATKSEWWLVSQHPMQNIMGTVPYSFQNRAAATQAMDRFKEGTVWEAKCPSFDKRARVAAGEADDGACHSTD